MARMEPASLTKLMTAYIVFQELAAGKLKLDEPVTVSEHAWRSEGSRTFIELGKPVSVEDLILGMIVQSGNDATIALAERIAGTEETFAQMMNANAKRLGMVGHAFREQLRPALAAALHHGARHVAAGHRHDSRLSAVLQMVIRCANSSTTASSSKTATACSRRIPRVDGLKTGHTDSAGFCLVTSALRDGMRLVSVVLGSTSMKARENASAALLNYGFTFYDTKLVVKGGTVLATDAGLEGGRASPVDLGIKDDLYITLPRGEARHQDGRSTCSRA